MRYPLLALPILLLFATAASADRNPDCKDSTLRDQPLVIDAIASSTVKFCSPSHGATGGRIPDDHRMTCTLLIGGAVVETIENVGPEQLMPHTDESLRFSQPGDVACTNSEGEGRLAAAVSVTFRPDAPGRPSILPGP